MPNHSIFNGSTQKKEVKASIKSISEGGTESIHKVSSVHFDEVSSNEIEVGLLTASGQELIITFTKDGKKG